MLFVLTGNVVCVACVFIYLSRVMTSCVWVWRRGIFLYIKVMVGQVKNNFIQQLEIGMSDGVRNCTIMIGYSFCIGIKYVLILTLGDLQCWCFNDWRKSYLTFSRRHLNKAFRLRPLLKLQLWHLNVNRPLRRISVKSTPRVFVSWAKIIILNALAHMDYMKTFPEGGGIWNRNLN